MMTPIFHLGKLLPRPPFPPTSSPFVLSPSPSFHPCLLQSQVSSSPPPLPLRSTVPIENLMGFSAKNAGKASEKGDKSGW